MLKPNDVMKLPEGKYCDGDYLWLVVKGGSRSWVVRGPRKDGKRPQLGLGSAAKVSLALARKGRDALLEQWRNGVDPIAEKHKAKEAAAKRKTFAEAAEAVIKKNIEGWKVNALRGSSSTLSQWRHDLEVVCRPIAGLPIDQIGLDDIKPIIMPYFDAKHDDAANGLRRRIESVFDHAFAHNLRTAGNPATSKIWKELAPKRKKIEGEEEHHAAVPWQEVPAVLARIRASNVVAARLAEFVILTAARSQEARGARWEEIDLDRKVWTIPASRMKMGREHEVPLSAAAVELLASMPRAEFIFPGGRGREAQAKCAPMSHQGLWAFVERACGATVHGFRSAFKDWADNNGVADRLSEKCLAHLEEDKVRRAYARDQLTEPRRPIMEAWGAFVDGARDNVLPFVRQVA